MYQVGTDVGNTYEVKQGEGFSQVIGFPKTDNANLWLAQKRERDSEKKNQNEQIERRKALGDIETLKTEGFAPHYQEIQSDIDKFVTKASKDMLTMTNPFDLTDPKGKENLLAMKKIQGKIAISKNIQNEWDAMENGNHKDTDQKSYDEKRAQYLNTPLSAWADGKVNPVKLKPKNPYQSQEVLFSAKIKQAQDEATQRGVDLADEPQKWMAITKDMMQNDDAKDFYKTYYESLPKAEQEKYDQKGIEQLKNGTSTDKFNAKYEAMAYDFVPNLLTDTPFDEAKAGLEIAKSTGDEIDKTERGDVTIGTKNTSAVYNEKLRAKVKNLLTSDSVEARRARKTYGVTIDDIEKGTEKGKQALKRLEDVSKPNVDKGYTRSEDEEKRWKTVLAEKAAKAGEDSPDQVLSDLMSGQPLLQQQAAQHIIGKNNSLGGVIDKAEVVKARDAKGLSKEDAELLKGNDNYGIVISYTVDDPDSQGHRQQRTRFIQGTAENHGNLKDLIEGSNHAQRKSYKRVIGKSVTLDAAHDAVKGTTAPVQPQSNMDKVKNW